MEAKTDERIFRILNEWKLDFDNISTEKKIDPMIALRIGLIRGSLQGNRLALRFLAEKIKQEWVNNGIGVMPGKDIKIIDAYSREKFDFSIREEQHEFYWLVQDLLKGRKKNDQR